MFMLNFCVVFVFYLSPDNMSKFHVMTYVYIVTSTSMRYDTRNFYTVAALVVASYIAGQYTSIKLI